jgi:hypothetical protein
MLFGPAYADKDIKDLYCSDWIVLLTELLITMN